MGGGGQKSFIEKIPAYLFQKTYFGMPILSNIFLLISGFNPCNILGYLIDFNRIKNTVNSNLYWDGHIIDIHHFQK